MDPKRRQITKNMSNMIKGREGANRLEAIAGRLEAIAIKNKEKRKGRKGKKEGKAPFKGAFSFHCFSFSMKHCKDLPGQHYSSGRDRALELHRVE